MTCCNPLVRKQFTTVYVNGACKSVLQVQTTDADTGVVTISYEDPSTTPPTAITGTILPGPCDTKVAPPMKDHEVVVMCDPDGKQIVIQYDTSEIPPVVAAMLDTSTGAPWTGDITTLAPCNATVESDPVLMCDNEVQFLRHMIKRDGEPTGAKFDTKLDGSLYTVTNEAAVIYGECSGLELESDAVTVCNDGTTLTMWVVKANSVPTGVKYFTDAAGTVVTVADETQLALGSCAELTLICDPATQDGVQATWG